MDKWRWVGINEAKIVYISLKLESNNFININIILMVEIQESWGLGSMVTFTYF